MSASGVVAETPVDEAKAAGKTADDYPEAQPDLFHEMDGGVELTPEEWRGRNTWMLWSAGNQAFWDWLATHSYGLTDLLRVVVSERHDRLERFGLINEPGFTEATEPDEFGLMIDRRADAEPGLWNPSGVDPAVYGYSSGVIGLRIFPNPNFDEAARADWSPERYADPDDVEYHKDVVRPYRVGMTCAFCHVAHHPLHPALDAENPEWSNLSNSIGNQWFNTGEIFATAGEDSNFVVQLLRQVPRGTTDTSLIASDNNNNPNTMNAIWQVAERLRIAVPEALGEATLAMPDKLFPVQDDGTRLTPHVLVDGADSIGILGALARVYVNIGEFHQEWITHHNPLVGIREQSPVPLATVQENSVYWQASAKRVVNLARFFAKSATRMPLADAPGGAEHLSDDEAVLQRGKRVFAQNCMGCHSSKQPDFVVADLGNLELRNSPEYEAWALEAVSAPDFLENNYLSTDQRIPVTVVQTNAGRALADNATRGHIWDNFSSETYKGLPSVGEIFAYDPFTGEEFTFQAPSGGPGYYRVPSLVGIWATAPFFHNNSLGLYNGDPSVEGRLAAFDDAVRKLLWPETRDSEFRFDQGKDRWVPTRFDESVWRTTSESELHISAAYLPDLLTGVLNYRSRLILVHPWLLPGLVIGVGLIVIQRARRRESTRGFVGGVVVIVLGVGFGMLSSFLAGDKGDLRIGPVPRGTPVSLLANVSSHGTEKSKLIGVVAETKKTLRDIKRNGLTGDEAGARLRDAVGSDLLQVSKCPDLVTDRGHYFGAELGDADKLALIEFLKTF